MVRSVHSFELRLLALFALAVFLAGGQARALHALEHSLPRASLAHGCDAPADGSLERADAPRVQGDDCRDESSECALCVLAAAPLVGADLPVQAAPRPAARECFPSPQAAPRAGPLGVSPARAPPSAARA